jgi:hypothetical protein
VSKTTPTVAKLHGASVFDRTLPPALASCLQRDFQGFLTAFRLRTEPFSDTYLSVLLREIDCSGMSANESRGTKKTFCHAVVNTPFPVSFHLQDPPDAGRILDAIKRR